ncbi:carboxypeptidase-like regulatory domain-containing protein [Chitinophaga pendula]|uniref:carboxypeptidase-like regulatory domain-containing protein n=1 Tax=Chitinophaga TaxID=79328 RepID=UPI000BAE898D|nr:MULTISPECIES: carboxypeptidase-like regulatory domain-containing protein [Chitinophaga]ASZ10419.1 hypothetical protein CK934_05200 [Chitinophaga sp. MD30]UCJ06613.1 carboxypeptidase-like regulatory domain-containing protein [Chitinophaga pendula]
MITKKLYPVFLLVFLVIGAFLACHKETSLESSNGGTLPPLPEVIQTSLQGRVLNENQSPVQGATVTCGTITATTDVNGNFSFAKVAVPSAGAVIKATKPGYFTGSRTLLVNTNAQAYAQIELLPKKTAGTFDSRSGGTVSLPSTELTFVAGQVRNAAGQIYTGNVSIAFAYLNPESKNFRDIMPGDLRGVAQGGAQVGLQSFGMMAVELIGDNGETLQLDPAKKVTMKMNIPASLQASAPATIPLWYFDEASGLWKEDGSATKQGTQYVGTVSHFSFWNCDAPFTIVQLKALLLDAQGAVLPNLPVQIKKKSDNSIGYGYTNDKGQLIGMVPANAPLEMTILNDCGAVLLKQDLAPMTAATDLGTFKLAIPIPSALSVTGTVEDCNNNPVANGLVNILLEGKNYRAIISNGTFKVTLSRCTNTQVNAEFTLLDNATNALTTNTFQVSIGSITPSFKVCGQTADGIIDMNINNTSVKFTSPLDSVKSYLNTNSFAISGSPKRGADSTWLEFSVDSYTVGTANASRFSYRNPTSSYNNVDVKVTVTQIANKAGEYIIGSVSGNIKDINNVIVPVTGTFKVKREN